MRPGRTRRPVASIARRAGARVQPADRRDAVADDADVGAGRRRAGAVEHQAAVHHQVEHARAPYYRQAPYKVPLHTQGRGRRRWFHGQRR